MSDKKVLIGDTDMYYASFGQGKRKMVVLPGLSDGLITVNGKGLLLVQPYRKFLKDYTIYMFSRKNKMPEGYSIRDMANDQALAMKDLGIEKAMVLGVSQGGMIAQYLAIDHPEMVEKLILAVTAPYANEVAKEAVGFWIEMAEKEDQVNLMVDTAKRMYSDSYLDKNLRLFPLVAKVTKPKSYERFLCNAYAIMNFDAREELSKISCPTLILSGEDDKTVGNEAPGELHSLISGSKVHIFEGLGHGAFEEAPDFYDRVFAFCDD